MKTIYKILPIGVILLFSFRNPDNATNEFAVKIYQSTVVDSVNSVISPISINMALALLQEGAVGTTKYQLQQALGIANQSAGVYYKNLRQKLEFQSTKEFKDCLAGDSLFTGQPTKAKMQFSMYNSIWGLYDLPLNSAFIETSKKFYDAEIKQITEDQIPYSGTLIDSWIKEKSNNRISSGGNALDSKHPFTLINVTYFLGEWGFPFDKSKTKSGKFIEYDQTKVETDFMRGEFHIDYSEGNDFQAIALPYRCTEMKMILIVPKKKLGLVDFEKNINTKKLSAILSMTGETVHLKMPKFRIETNLSVIPALASLGVTDFSQLGNVSSDTRVTVNNIIHKVFIDVNEETTEAAALTEIVIVGGTGEKAEPPIPKIVTADHPFMFLLMDDATQTITFMGRVITVEAN